MEVYQEKMNHLSDDRHGNANIATDKIPQP